MSLVETFLSTADHRGDAIALIEGSGRKFSFAELARDSAIRAVAYSQVGVVQGDNVLVAKDVGAGLYSSLLALWRLGAVAVFPEPGAGLQGLRNAIAATRPVAAIAGPRAKVARLLAPEFARLPILPDRPKKRLWGSGKLASVKPNSPSLITFTSGSTGRPKGIVRTSDFLLLQHRMLESIRQTRPEDVDLISLPIFVLSNLAAGATSVIPDGNLRAPARLNGARLHRQMVDHSVTRIIGPPALCKRLVEARASQLRAIFTGGGPVFPNLWRALRRAAPAARICAIYGSTEAEPIAHIEFDEISNEDWAEMAAGGGLLAGRPIPEIELTIHHNEIEVAGPHVNATYLDPIDNLSTKVERKDAIWHRTGDCGRLDASGRLWLLGRAAAADKGIYPFAVETAALSWPGVREAAMSFVNDRAILAVAGSNLNVGQMRTRARQLDISDVIPLRTLPTDKRHNSKIDYTRLQAMLINRLSFSFD